MHIFALSCLGRNKLLSWGNVLASEQPMLLLKCALGITLLSNERKRIWKRHMHHRDRHTHAPVSSDRPTDRQPTKITTGNQALLLFAAALCRLIITGR